MQVNMHESDEALWTYNCRDCINTREVGEREQALVREMGLEAPEAFQQSLIAPVLQAMNRGVRVDKEKRTAMALELQEELAKREQYFQTALGHPLNPRSSKQMTTLFYNDLGQRPIMSRPTRQSPSHVTCNDEALETLYARELLLRPLIRWIQEYRSLGVFLSTFVNAPLDIDGRMRCSYNICGTVGYRFSSSENAFGSGTNLQNIPKGGAEDDSDLELPNIRSLFIPDPDYTFFDIDLSSADLRIVVYEADEREMKAMLAEGKNPYVEVAKEYYHDSSITKQHPRYRTFKSFAHGTHYLGSARGLAARLGLGVHEVEKLQKWYFGKFPRIQAYQQRIKDDITLHHQVSNVFGYRCHFFDRVSDETFRQAAAWIPSSTVAILINKIWVNLYNDWKFIAVLLQVHDSLCGEFPTNRKQEAIDAIKKASQIILPYEDPLIIPIGVATSEKSWGDCH